MSGHTGIDAERDIGHPYAKMFKDHNPGAKVHKPPMPTVEDCKSVEETIQELEAIPSNKKLLKQIGVRESLFRVRTAAAPPPTPRPATHAATHAHPLKLLVDACPCRSAFRPRHATMPTSR